MKYAWIADHCNVYGVATLCRVLQVSRCGYHQNQGRAPSERSMANRIVVAHLKQFHQEYCHTYGRRRMRNALLAESIAAGEQRIRRLMRQHHLEAHLRRRWRPRGSVGTAIGLTNTLAQTPIVVHSDQGSQYMSQDYQSLLKRLNCIPSVSKQGNCYDNAMMESFFHSLKVESLYRHPVLPMEQTRSLIFNYIEGFYNPKRAHSALNYLSPNALIHYTNILNLGGLLNLTRSLLVSFRSGNGITTLCLLCCTFTMFKK